jgi:hypothetical protein
MLRNVTQGLGLGRINWDDLSNGKMEMRFGTGNVRTLYRSGSLKTVSRGLAK